MLTKLKRKNILKYLIVFTLIEIVYHLLMREYGGDTLSFYAREIKQMSPSSLFKATYDMYQTWSSRFLIEALTFIFSYGVKMFEFSIVDILMNAILLLSLMKLTDYKHNLLLTCLLLMYPVHHMAGVGWIAGYTHYLWPVACIAAGLVSLKKMYDNEKFAWYEIPFYLGCIMLGANLEVGCAFYIIMLTLFSILMILNNFFNLRFAIFTAIQYFIAITELILHLTCPGNNSRYGSSVGYWFFDYLSLSIQDKCAIAINSAASILFSADIIWILFCILLFLIALIKKDASTIALSAIPTSLVLLESILKPFSINIYPGISELFDKANANMRVDAVNYNRPAVYVIFIAFMTALTIVLLLLIHYAKDLKSAIVICVIFGAALSTRLVLAFSPTVYESGFRTFMLLDYTLIFLIVKLYDLHLKDNYLLTKASFITKPLVLTATCISVFANMASISLAYMSSI